MSKQKEHVKHYDRKEIDWRYVNFLEDKIKILEEELRIEKKLSGKFKQERNYLKHQTIPQLENKISYYKQSLL